MKRRVLLITIVLALGISTFFRVPQAQLQEGNDPPAATIEPLLLLPTATETIVFTPSPTIAVTTEGIVFSSNVQVIFPQAVRFTTIILRKPDEITRLALTIEQDERAAETFEVNLDTALLQAEPNPEFEFLWEIDPANPPALFSEINYRWQVQSQFNEDSAATGIFQWTDSRVLWESYQTPDERLTLAMPRGQGLASLAPQMAQVATQLETVTRQSLNARMVFYNERLDANGQCLDEANDAATATPVPFAERIVLCEDEALLRQTIENGSYALLRNSAPIPRVAADVISAYMVELAYAPLWANANVPAWFREGWAILFSPAAKDLLYAPATNAAQANQLIPIDRLQQVPTDATSYALWRAQSYAMVLYMVDQVGLSQAYTMARELGNANFEQAYEQASGQSLNSLLPALRNWLITADARRAFGLTIYQDATATLAPSATFTPFPATRTPRPTITPSPLPGTLTATPTLTRTPTRIPPSATPTVTPRPASSLFTATPVPAQNTPLIAPTTRTGVLALLVIIIAILLIIYTRVGKR
jgi:hypothetical protein